MGAYERFPCTLVVFDYRGYGWSTGRPSMVRLTKDAEACTLKLQSILARHQLPWPWPAPVIIVGRSLGSVVATSLVGKFPDMFDGIILDSGIASSRAENYAHISEGITPVTG